MSDYLRIPQNGFKEQEGGMGIRIYYKQLADELKITGHMKEDEVLSQVNIEDDNLVLVFTKIKEKGNGK